MKRNLKVVLVIAVLVMSLAVVLLANKGTVRDLTLDFKNSGQFEWYELVEIENADDSNEYSLGFKNSGQFEWYELVEIKATRTLRRTNGFKNSGLPETIELKSCDF